ncbi:15477_t:CDS:2, partial [Dentiscutata erythropus]
LKKKSSSTSERSYRSTSSKSLEETRSDTSILSNFSLSELNFSHNFVSNTLWGSTFSSPVEDILTTNGKVLEVGCGFGYWLTEMATAYPKSEFIGADLNPQSSCTFPPNAKIIKGDLLQLPFEDGEFDFTRISGFSCEISDIEWEQGLSEMTRVTKRGGWIEISECDMFPQKNTPNTKLLMDNFVDAIELRGLNGRISSKVEYILYNINQLTEIHSAIKPVLLGPRGGPTGITLLLNMGVWFRDVCDQILTDHMGITQERYLELWQFSEEELEKNDAEMYFYRWWGQKKLE